MCPHCGREAPLIYRGALAYCSACNNVRTPLSATGVNLAGKPARFGGTVARVVGWVVLAVTLGIALIVGAIFQAIFTAAVGWIVGGVIAALGAAAAIALLMGGRFLKDTGDKATFAARRSALFALAQNQHVILRTPIVAQALGVSPVEAEAILTGFSRDPESGITLEVDPEGRLYFRLLEIAAQFPQYAPGAALPEAARVRVEKTQIPEDAPAEDDDAAAETRAKRARM